MAAGWVRNSRRRIWAGGRLYSPSPFLGEDYPNCMLDHGNFGHCTRHRRCPAQGVARVEPLAACCSAGKWAQTKRMKGEGTNAPRANCAAEQLLVDRFRTEHNEFSDSRQTVCQNQKS